MVPWTTLLFLCDRGVEFVISTSWGTLSGHNGWNLAFSSKRFPALASLSSSVLLHQEFGVTHTTLFMMYHIYFLFSFSPPLPSLSSDSKTTTLCLQSLPWPISYLYGQLHIDFFLLNNKVLCILIESPITFFSLLYIINNGCKEVLEGNFKQKYSL